LIAARPLKGKANSDHREDSQTYIPVCPTLRAGGNRTGGDRPPGTDVDTCESLIAFDTTQITSKANYSNPKPGAPCHPLASGAHPPAVAFGGNNTSGPIDQATACNAKGGPGRSDFESETFIAHSLHGEGFDASEDGTGRGTPLTVAIGFSNVSDGSSARNAGNFSGPLTCRHGDPGCVAFALQDDTTPKVSRELNGALRRDAGGEGACVGKGMQVRRLTPRECERLQGFPDGYTLIPWRGGMAPDGPRYKALGNSMAVPVMRWVGERIQKVEESQVFYCYGCEHDAKDGCAKGHQNRNNPEPKAQYCPDFKPTKGKWCQWCGGRHPGKCVLS